MSRRLSDDWVSAYAPTLGRILVGGYFLWVGIEAAFYFPDAVAQIAALNPAWPVAATLGIIAVEVLGGLALVAGFQTRAAALIMALYAIAAAFLYAPLSGGAGSLFLSHIAIVGGLLYIAGTQQPRP